MRTALTLTATTLMLIATPTVAGSLQVYEGTHGAPGVTAELAPGTVTTNLDFDADTGEGGGIAVGPTEVELRPTGSVAFVDFTCDLPGCNENVDYVFTPGDAASGGRVIVSDSAYSERQGVYDLGQLGVSGSDGGSVELVGCNYIGADGVERSCDAFTVATLPEPGFAAFAAGVALLAGLRRRR